MRLMHLGIEAHVVGDTTTPAAGRGDLLLVTSGTASTATLLPVAARAEERGARRATVTATPNGALARGADLVVHVPAPASHEDPWLDGAPLLPMGSRFELAAALLFEAVTVRLMQRRGVTVEAMFARHANLE
jgi:6-phospho-3-hexuloisomerase